MKIRLFAEAVLNSTKQKYQEKLENIAIDSQSCLLSCVLASRVQVW